MRKRSKYRPRGVIPDTMGWLMKGMTKVADSEGGSIITRTRIKNHISIEALRKGQAERDDISTLIEAFNVTEALARMEIGHEYKTEIRAAQDAVFALCVRATQRGKFIATGPELVAINLGMEIHDAQLDICTIKEMEQALDYVWRVISSNKARVVPSPPTPVTPLP